MTAVHRYRVWDDGLDIEDAEKLKKYREKYLGDMYDFKIVRSEFHDNKYQIEGMKK